MWILLILIIIIFVLLILKSLKKRSKSSVSSTYTVKAIEDCISSNDVQYKIASETQRIISNVEKSRAVIKSALAEADRNINTAWLNSYEKIIKVSSNLDENLIFHRKKVLDQSKFHYYTNLHFRSMIAANLTYREFEEINKSFCKMNELIVDIARNKKRMNTSKAQIYNAKDALKQLRNCYLNRVHTLNHNTAKLRDKIGRECGTRGEAWLRERMRKHL